MGAQHLEHIDARSLKIERGRCGTVPCIASIAAMIDHENWIALSEAVKGIVWLYFAERSDYSSGMHSVVTSQIVETGVGVKRRVTQATLTIVPVAGSING